MEIGLLDKNFQENIKIGENTEIFLVDLLKQINNFSNVIRLGNLSEKFNIKIQLKDGTTKGIQIKTLTEKINKRDVYYINNKKIYDDQILVVMINKERTRFALDFFKNIKHGIVELPFSSTRSKYINIMYKDLNLFTDKLIELIPYSLDYELILSKNLQKENDMFNRLESFCLKKKWDFKLNDSNYNGIDLYINDCAFQAKYISLNDNTSNTYKIPMTKKIDSIVKPYDISDKFDYIVAEVGGYKTDNINDLTMFHNCFCIISKMLLIQNEIIKTDTCSGKTSMQICAPNYSKDHWSKLLWHFI